MNLRRSIQGLASATPRSKKLRLETLESRRVLAAFLQVRAAGQTGEEAIALLIDNQTVAEWSNLGGDYVSGEFQQFNYVHPVDVTPDQIRVAFTNDGRTASGADRNVRIDGISINDRVYESESPGVFSNGSWDGSCEPGNKQSEFLHCPGYFQYADTVIEILAAGATGEEALELQIDGQTVETWNNVGGDLFSGTFETFQYTSPDPISISDIRVVFPNDAGVNRDLRVDAVVIDGVRYATASPEVFSTGSWDLATGCQPGNKSIDVLHCNGYFQYSGSRIEIRAAGATGEEAIALKINGQTAATWSDIEGDFSNREFVSFSYVSPTSVTIDQLEVAFINDGRTADSEDKNVRIDALVLDGIVYEAEAVDVFSSGTWQATNGCLPGNKTSEFLHCNGSFQFGVTPSRGSLALGDSLFAIGEEAGQILIPFVRTGGSDGQVSLDYTTIDATATAGDDFVASTGTVVFQPGETLKNVPISIVNDDNQEGNETFTVSADAVGGGAGLGQPRTATVTIVDDDQGPTPGSGNGLLGVYFDDATLNTSVFERTDATINFDWGNGSPDARIAPDTFSVRWEGQIEPLFSENYSFYTSSDDGVRLWVDDQLLVDNWTDHGVTVDTGQIDLLGGQRYDIRMEMYENGGSAVAKLEWSSVSQSREIVPELQLYSDAPSNLTGTFAGQTIVTGLNQPTAIEFASGGKMFIAQQNGIVRLAENGTLLSQPFIDISAQVNGVRDRGLLGIEVHPNFPSQPYVYLLFTYDPPETQSFPSTSLASPDKRGNRVSRLIRVSADPANNYRTALPNSEVVILGKNSVWENISGPDKDSTNNFSLPPSCQGVDDCVPIDSQSHTIGALAFGNDGSLYVSSGDGTSYGRVDPRTVRVQDLNSLAGKILRIDSMTGEGLATNPFYNNDPNSNQSKVYSLGLRNPFRIAVHPVLDEPYIGEVGWTAWEEINSGRGANFGWPYYEGGDGQNLETGGYRDLPEAQAFYNSNQIATPGLWSRTHSDGARAIVLGDFYQGNRYPELLQNALFFSDYGEPTVRALILNEDGSFNRVQQISGGVGAVVEMTNGPDGYMYYVDIVSGSIGRFTYTETAANVAAQSSSAPNGGASSGIAIVQDGSETHVYAKDTSNRIAFDFSRPEVVRIDDVDHTIPLSSTTVNIYALAGQDSVDISGSNTNNDVEFRPGLAEVRSESLTLRIFDIERAEVSVSGGNSNRAEFHDSPGDETFKAYPDMARFESDEFVFIANGFSQTFAFANSGGNNDQAFFYDSSGADHFRATPTEARMRGDGFYNYAEGFDRAIAISASGADIAILLDSEGDDRFISHPTRSILTGAGFRNEARGFRRVHAIANRGGNDRAMMFDSSNNDRFIARRNYAILLGAAFNNRATGFEHVTARSRSGGTDRLNVDDVDFVLRTLGPWI